MSTEEFQWIIWLAGMMFAILPILTVVNRGLGLLIGNLLMWPLTIVSLGSFTETLKDLGIGM